MQITALKAQVKDPNRVSVFIDGKFHCGLTLSQIAELGVTKGEIEESYAHTLKNHSDLGKLRTKTVEWLFRRPRSRRELSDYLYKKQANPDEKEYVTGRVERYMDDEAFAKFWIEGRRGSKNKSARVIQGELQQKGVPKEITQKLLAEHEATDQEMLANVIAKKSRQTRYQDQQKLKEYLMRQGFSYSDICEALKNDDESTST